MIGNGGKVGFVHDVLNTDNMSILGLTIDYGPMVGLNVMNMIGHQIQQMRIKDIDLVTYQCFCFGIYLN